MLGFLFNTTTAIILYCFKFRSWVFGLQLFNNVAFDVGVMQSESAQGEAAASAMGRGRGGAAFRGRGRGMRKR